MYTHTAVVYISEGIVNGNRQWNLQNFVHTQKEGEKISLIHNQN